MVKGRVAVITGIPGAGKSTVLNELKRIAGKIGKGIRVVNFGTEMVKIAEQKSGVLHRDEIRHKPIPFQNQLQTEAAKEIAKMTGEGSIVIVDTHMMVRTESGYWAGLPSHVITELKPDLFILIEADPEEIFKRRSTDKTRMRDKVLMSDIREEIEFSRAFAATCGTLTGAPVKIVRNPAGRQVEAAEEILKLL